MPRVWRYRELKIPPGSDCAARDRVKGKKRPHGGRSFASRALRSVITPHWASFPAVSWESPSADSWWGAAGPAPTPLLAAAEQVSSLSPNQHGGARPQGERSQGPARRGNPFGARRTYSHVQSGRRACGGPDHSPRVRGVQIPNVKFPPLRARVQEGRSQGRARPRRSARALSAGTAGTCEFSRESSASVRGSFSPFLYCCWFFFFSFFFAFRFNWCIESEGGVSLSNKGEMGLRRARY